MHRSQLIHYKMGILTLPSSSRLGMETVKTPSFNWAETLTESTGCGSQTVRENEELPTNWRSEGAWSFVVSDALVT